MIELNISLLKTIIKIRSLKLLIFLFITLLFYKLYEKLFLKNQKIMIDTFNLTLFYEYYIKNDSYENIMINFGYFINFININLFYFDIDYINDKY